MEEVLLTAHVGVVKDWFAPNAVAIILIGAHPELILRVGLQVVDDCVTGRTCLVDPLPVSLPVPNGVEPEGGQEIFNKWEVFPRV